LENFPPRESYHYINNETKNYCEEIINYSSKDTLDLYHRLVLLRLISNAKGKLENRKLPMVTKSAYSEYFKKIVDDIDSYKNATGFYLFPNDAFKKDLGICRLNLIPAGHALLEIRNLPKRFLLKGGIKQFIQGVLFIVFELGGFHPLLERHLDSRPDSISLQKFNPEGRKGFYLITAEILRMNPEIKGTFNTCWYFDPKIKEISPKLTYIRELDKQFGGKYFFMGTNEQCINDATFKSPTRRKLFQEGKYLPTNYLLIVPRGKLIKAAGG